MSETEYISGMEGMYGDSQVLLDGDVDLSANLPPCGYLVAKFLAPDLIAKMRAATEALVRDTSLTFSGRKHLWTGSASRATTSMPPSKKTTRPCTAASVMASGWTWIQVRSLPLPPTWSDVSAR